MTTLANRPNPALLVIDVQKGVMARTHDRDRVVANIAALVARARACEVDVVWVQHRAAGLEPGSEAWQYVPELVPQEGEAVVAKEFGDSFEATDLADVLAERAVGHLYVTGAQTDQCVRSTLHGAFVRGYDATLVADAHTTEDLSPYGAPTPEKVVAHTNLYWQHQTAPGRTAGTMDSVDVHFVPAERA